MSKTTCRPHLKIRRIGPKDIWHRLLWLTLLCPNNLESIAHFHYLLQSSKFLVSSIILTRRPTFSLEQFSFIVANRDSRDEIWCVHDFQKLVTNWVFFLLIILLCSWNSLRLSISRMFSLEDGLIRKTILINMLCHLIDASQILQSSVSLWNRNLPVTIMDYMSLSWVETCSKKVWSESLPWSLTL